MAQDLDLYSYCADIVSDMICTPVSKYSPNNVRRLIISPDGVVMQYFVKVSGLYFKSVKFEPVKFVKCVESPRYRAMIGVLAGKNDANVCSHVEEVLVCRRSTNNLCLSPAELDFSNLIDKSMSTTKESVMRRFVRLYDFTVVDCSINQLGELIQKSGSTYTEQLYDFFKARNLIVSSELFNTTDWYTKTRLRPKHYNIDGGILKEKLDAIESKLSKVKEEKKASEFKYFVTKDAITSLTKSVTALSSILSGLKKFGCIKTATSVIAQMVFADSNAEFCIPLINSKFSLGCNKVISELKGVDYSILSDDTITTIFKRFGASDVKYGTDKSKYTKLAGILTEMTQSMYLSLISRLDSLYSHYAKGYSTTLSVLRSSSDLKIGGLEALNDSQLVRDVGICKVSLDTSLTSIFILLSALTFNLGTLDSKYLSSEYWGTKSKVGGAG